MANDATETLPTSTTARPGPSWRSSLAVFGASRVLSLFVVWLATRTTSGHTAQGVLTNWDGNWYELIVAGGYPSSPGPGGGFGEWSRLAFFPLYPAIVRSVEEVTPLGYSEAGIFVSLLCAGAAMAVLHRLVATVYDDTVAWRTVALVSFAPAGYIFTMMYTEGLAMLLVALTFLSLQRRRPATAALWAFLGSLSRPNGFILVVPLAIVGWREFRSSRDLRHLLPVLAAPAGFAAWVAYAWYRTGAVDGYFRIQQEIWGARIDFGAETARSFVDVVTGDWANPNATIGVFVLAVSAFALVVGRRLALPPEWWWYALAVVVLVAINARQLSAARFVLLAFPLFVVPAKACRADVFGWLLASSACLMSAMLMASAAPNFSLTP